MNAVKWLIAGLIGGLAGALVWSVIVYFANYEIGWIAWGIGALVGICVRVGAGEENVGPVPGVGAIGLAVLSIVIGKYFAAVMLAMNMPALPTITFEDYQLSVANGDVEPPPYATWEQVPPHRKAEVQQEWEKLSLEEKGFILKLVGGGFNFSASNLFVESFGPFDILWFLLAAGTAYRLGSGTSEED